MTRDSGGFFEFAPLSYGKEAAPGKGVRPSFINDERDPQGTMVFQGQMHRVLDQLPGAPIRFRLSLDQGVLSLTAGLALQGVVAQYPFWQHVPDAGRWVRAGAEEMFNTSGLERVMDHER